MARQSTTLTEMREVVMAAFQAAPDALANPTAAAHCAVAAIQRHWAGCEGLYIPKLDTLEARDWEMWEMYNGANVDDIALRFGLTNRQVSVMFADRYLQWLKELPDCQIGVFGEMETARFRFSGGDGLILPRRP